MAARFRVAEVIRSCWEVYNRTHRIVPGSARVVGRLLACRTAALGGHLHRCDRCGGEVPVYNSCEDRHCPTCQTSARVAWTQQRLAEVLPVQYFHVVFTLPHRLNLLVDANRKLLFNELFATVGWTLQRFARDPQWRLEGELGYTAVLHTWNQKLQEHFHVHCLVPGGVWREEAGEWIPCRGRWLFKKESMADAFRNRYLKRLRSLRKRGKLNLEGCAEALAEEEAFDRLLSELQQERWIVYPKAVPKDPKTALEYLARYTYKVAISDHRIKDLRDGMVTFTWRDRADGNKEKPLHLPVEEFTKRFLYHILPRGFHRIRYGGFMSAAKRKPTLRAIREVLGVGDEPPPKDDRPLEQRILEETGIDIARCPHCQKGRLVRTSVVLPPVKKPP